MEAKRPFARSTGVKRPPGIVALAAGLLALSLLLIVGACGVDRSAGGSADVRSTQVGISLEGAPWLDQSDGAPALEGVVPWPSLRFPAGMTYEDALTRLFEAARETGRTPEEAHLAPALPNEIVLVQSARPEDGIRLSLTAPWGWAGTSAVIRAPSFNLPGSLTPEDVRQRLDDANEAGEALPRGARIDVPGLLACQVLNDPPNSLPPCE